MTETIEVTLEHLDFTAEIPCEHSQHEEDHAPAPAKYIIQTICLCGFDPYAICQDGLEKILLFGWYCPDCNTTNETEGNGLTILRNIN